MSATLKQSHKATLIPPCIFLNKIVISGFSSIKNNTGKMDNIMNTASKCRHSPVSYIGYHLHQLLISYYGTYFISGYCIKMQAFYGVPYLVPFTPKIV